MGFDPARDIERWQRALAATSAALLVVLVGFGLAEWRAFARDVVEQPAVTNVVERCPSCHQPPAAHGAALEAHRRRGVGCSDCHGGRPGGLRLASVHFAPGAPTADPRLRAPGIEASCMRCHVPGGAAGTERLSHGARLYLGLGCAACHPLGAGGAGYAPDLSAVGWRSPAELRARLLGTDPARMGSSMPSFAAALREPTDLDDLLVFLEGLALAPVARGRASPRADALVSASCTDCHEPGAWVHATAASTCVSVPTSSLACAVTWRRSPPSAAAPSSTRNTRLAPPVTRPPGARKWSSRAEAFSRPWRSASARRSCRPAGGVPRPSASSGGSRWITSAPSPPSSSDCSRARSRRGR